MAVLLLYPINVWYGPIVTLGLTVICHIGPDYHIGPIIIMESNYPKSFTERPNINVILTRNKIWHLRNFSKSSMRAWQATPFNLPIYCISKTKGDSVFLIAACFSAPKIRHRWCTAHDTLHMVPEELKCLKLWCESNFCCCNILSTILITMGMTIFKIP